MTASNLDIKRCVLKLLSQRAASASICPSDVARALASDNEAWRAMMHPVKGVAAQLAREGKISITQGSATLDPSDPKQIEHGPIRLRRGPHFDAP
jgi:hypothetical protein